MVTLRRDTSSYMNMGAMSESLNLTDYDKYVLSRQTESRQTRSRFDDTPNYFSGDILRLFNDNQEVEETSAEERPYIAKFSPKKTYEDYMAEVLNRTNKNEKVLTREEFELGSSREVSTFAKSEEAIPGKLTKGGKIFVGVYVLLIAICAFVLIAINTFAKGEEAMADGAPVVETVEAMDKDADDAYLNWFDSICDSLNK